LEGGGKRGIARYIKYKNLENIGTALNIKETEKILGH
jgi:hypothetical protein